MICVVIDHFIAFLQHKLVRVLCYTLRSLLPSICSSLPWNITTFYVKNVVGISPPLKNSWYGDTSHHHHYFLGPRVDSNQGTNKWAVLFGFRPSSNPIALKLMVGRSFLDYWLLNHHSNVGRATQPIFRVHLSTIVKLCMFSSSIHQYIILIWQMLSPCSHNCGNPSFGNFDELSLSSSATSLSSPWVNDELLLTEITS